MVTGLEYVVPGVVSVPWKFTLLVPAVGPEGLKVGPGPKTMYWKPMQPFCHRQDPLKPNHHVLGRDGHAPGRPDGVVFLDALDLSHDRVACGDRTDGERGTVRNDEDRSGDLSVDGLTTVTRRC